MLRQFLNRADRGALDLQYRYQAAVDKLVIDENRARTALPFSATFLRSREAKVFSQNIEQAFHRGNVNRSPCPVHGETDRAPRHTVTSSLCSRPCRMSSGNNGT